VKIPAANTARTAAIVTMKRALVIIPLLQNEMRAGISALARQAPQNATPVKAGCDKILVA
jgi:hypothetical protein